MPIASLSLRRRHRLLHNRIHILRAPIRRDHYPLLVPVRLLTRNWQYSIPRNNNYPQKRAQTTKHQRHYPPRRESRWQRRRRDILARQVKQIHCVPCSIALRRNTLCLTRLNVVLRRHDRVLQIQRCLDEGCDQTGCRVPFDVTVEEPDAWVVSAETDDEIAEGSDEEGIAAHWGLGEVGLGCVGGVVGAGAGEAAGYGLEVVPMQVEGVFARVEVVEDDFDYVVFVEHEGVCVAAVDFGGCGGGTRG